LNAKVCPEEDSLSVEVVGDVNDNGRSVHDGNDIVNRDVNTTHSLFSGRQTAGVPLYKVKTSSDTKRRDPKQSVLNFR
jgi:hypothetical protein